MGPNQKVIVLKQEPLSIPQTIEIASTTSQSVPLDKKGVKPPVISKPNPVEFKERAIVKTPVQIEKPKELIPLEMLNEKVRTAMVNIFCKTKTGGSFNPISGSGIVISKKGVILTNAHVAQYVLLKDYGVKDFISCIGRTGSPASPAYKIELLYFPPNWLTDNAKSIKAENPQGTGENDYALFLITETLTNTPLPESFSFIDIDTDQKHITGDIPVLLSGYPVNFLGGIETERELWLTSSPASITKLYYFNEKENVDAFSVGSNIVAQKGVSGGGAINQWSGRLEGISTTVTDGTTTGDRDLVAISIAHIDRSIKENTGKGLDDFLAGDLQKTLLEFTEKKLPGLTKTLTEAVESTSTPSH